jgi:hypothetical protein
LKLQVSVREFASTAVHDTAVVPTGNCDPLVAEHARATGWVPLLTVAAGNVTGMGNPFGEVTLSDAGQAILGGSAGGGTGVGPV